MSANIKASVGKRGHNDKDDVLIVQELLNQHASAGGYKKIKITGVCDKETSSAILAFQAGIGLKNPDGKIEPNKTTFASLKSSKIVFETEAPAAGGGKLVGKTSGVDSEIIDFASAVAAYYGKNINVVSGKRSADDQAGAMYRNWTKTLKRGKIYKHLSANPKLLDKLDQLYSTSCEDKTKTDEEKKAAKAEFLSTIVALGGKISLHLSGQAIDIAPACMTPAMREAMRTGMRELAEGKDGKACFHYDTSEGSVPAVTEAFKKKWKAP